MDRPPSKQDRRQHGGNTPIQQVPEHQPSVAHPDTRGRSYPTPIDIQGARIVRNHRLEELVNTAFPSSSQDNLNTASASNTIPTGPRAMNRAPNQAITATTPLQQQYFSRYPNSEPRPHRRGGSLGGIGYQVSQHQHYGQGPSRIQYAQSASHISSHPSTAPYQEPQYQIPSRIAPGYPQPQGFTRYPNSHEPRLHQRTGSLGEVPYQISQPQHHGLGQGPSRIPSEYSQYPTHNIPHIPTHSHSQSYKYTTPTQTPHFIASLFQTATSSQTSQTPRPIHPPRPATTQPSSSSSYPLPSNPVLSNPFVSNLLASNPLSSQPSSSNPLASHASSSHASSHPSSSNPLPSNPLASHPSSYPLGPLSSIPLPSTHPLPSFLQRNLDQCAPYLSPPRDDEESDLDFDEESDPDFERESIKTRFGPVVCKPVPEFLMGSMERTGSGRVFWRVPGSGDGSGLGPGTRDVSGGVRGAGDVRGAGGGEGREAMNVGNGGGGGGGEGDRGREGDTGRGEEGAGGNEGRECHGEEEKGKEKRKGKGKGKRKEEGQGHEGIKRVSTTSSLSSMASSTSAASTSSHSSRGGLNPRAPSYAFVSGSSQGRGQGNVVDMNRSSTSPAHLRRSYSQSSVYVPPLYSQQDQAGPSTSHSHVYNHGQSHSHTHHESQSSHHHQQQSQVAEFTPLITEIIPGYLPPASVSPSRATFSIPSSSHNLSSPAQTLASASAPPTITNPPQGSQEPQQPETLQIFDFDSAISAMRSYFRALPINAPSTDPALSPYSPLMSGVVVLWDGENRMNLRVRCLGLFVDGMGRPVGLGQRKVSGGSGKESSSGSDTVKAGEVGQVQPEKSALEIEQGEQRGGKEGGRSGKGKGKEKESGNGGGENNSSRRNERVFFRPVLIDGFPLGYVPLVYWQQDSEEVMRDQAMGIRMVMFRPRAGQGQVQTGSVMGGGMMIPQAGEQRDQAVQEWLEAEAMSVSEWQARMGNPEW